MEDASPDLFGDTATPLEERLRTQLAAVELLVARQDRDVQQHDILLATVFELLDGQSLSTASIERGVGEAWPGLRLLQGQLEAALDAASRIEHISKKNEDGVWIWELLPKGRDELQVSKDRAQVIVQRFEAALSDDLRDRGLPCTPGEASSLSAAVTTALRWAISQSFRASRDMPVERVGRWLRVIGTDLDQIAQYMARRVPDPERRDLVLSLVSLSLDQTSSFGAELVHHLITGHLLYVFMGRPDRRIAAETAGSLTGEVLIIDTPILLRLAGTPENRRSTLQLLTTARSLGMKIVLYERTVTEFDRYLDNLTTHEVAVLERSIRDGAPPEYLAQLTGQPGIRDWLLWACEQPSTDRSWLRWRETLGGPTGLFGTLSAIGVPVTPNPTYDLDASSLFLRLRDQLTAQVNQDGTKGRSAHVIEHDAHLLVEVWRGRQAQPSSGEKVWPGAYILSPDSQISTTYEAVIGRQVFPAALTFSQLAQIVGAYANPRVSEKLAFDIASGVAEQVLLARASVVPAELAGQLALTFADLPLSGSEIEQLSMDVRRGLDASRDVLEPGSVGHTEFVREMTVQWRQRRAALVRDSNDAATEERMRSVDATARREERIRALEEESAELRSARSAAPVVPEVSVLDRLYRERRAERVGMILAVAAVAAFAWDGVFPGVVLVVCSVVTFAFGREWARSRQTLLFVIVGAVVAVASVLSLLLTWSTSRHASPGRTPPNHLAPAAPGTTTTTSVRPDLRPTSTR